MPNVTIAMSEYFLVCGVSYIRNKYAKAGSIDPAFA
jgi:hypothetical protein